jgi:formate dehydrogenase assembly factor FdhD
MPFMQCPHGGDKTDFFTVDLCSSRERVHFAYGFDLTHGLFKSPEAGDKPKDDGQADSQKFNVKIAGKKFFKHYFPLLDFL